MDIALIGYGKLGKMIEDIILKEGKHKIIVIINSKDEINRLDYHKVDVAIEFTSPESVIGNISYCASKQIPIVIGTTGWHNEMEKIKNLIISNNSSLIWASNFSIGVNVFFHINKYVASLLNKFPEYEVSLKEIHHTQKKDAPSGTAISLAKDIALNKKVSFNDIKISSERKDEAVGYHEIKYKSLVDEIVISHNAYNREGFAKGAIHAAEFIVNKKGVFELKDIISL